MVRASYNAASHLTRTPPWILPWRSSGWQAAYAFPLYCPSPLRLACFTQHCTRTPCLAWRVLTRFAVYGIYSGWPALNSVPLPGLVGDASCYSLHVATQMAAACVLICFTSDSGTSFVYVCRYRACRARLLRVLAKTLHRDTARIAGGSVKTSERLALPLQLGLRQRRRTCGTRRHGMQRRRLARLWRQAIGPGNIWFCDDGHACCAGGPRAVPAPLGAASAGRRRSA